MERHNILHELVIVDIEPGKCRNIDDLRSLVSLVMNSFAENLVTLSV